MERNEVHIPSNCPCCNGRAETFHSDYQSNLHSVRCTVCGLRMDATELSDAVRRWNRRDGLMAGDGPCASPAA